MTQPWYRVSRKARCLGLFYFRCMYNRSRWHYSQVRAQVPSVRGWSAVILSFSTWCAFSLSTAVHRIEQCIDELKDWMTANYVQMNDSKSEILPVTPRHKTAGPRTSGMCRVLTMSPRFVTSKISVSTLTDTLTWPPRCLARSVPVHCKCATSLRIFAIWRGQQYNGS